MPHFPKFVLFRLVSTHGNSFRSQVRAFAEGALNTLQKAGASSGGDVLPPRDVTAEVIIARKTLTELLLEKAGGSLSVQDPHLAIALDFTASLVADLVYKKRYSDKNVWRSRVGVYMAPWLPNGKDGGTELAELICKHFYAIEKVCPFRGPHPQRLPRHCFRPIMLIPTMWTRKVANSSATPSSPLHMVPSSFSRTQISSSTAGAATVSLARTGLESQLLCVKCEMEK